MKVRENYVIGKMANSISGQQPMSDSCEVGGLVKSTSWQIPSQPI